MGNPLLGSLVDGFTGSVLDPNLWNRTTGTVTLDTVNDLVTLAVPTAAGGLNVFGTNNLYDATGQAISARVGVALAGNGTTKTVMRVRLDSNNAVTMRLESGVFKMTMQIGGVLTTTVLPSYDPAAHAWWRIREASGLFYADVSGDGWVWTNLASMAYSWSATAVNFQFEAGAGSTEAAGNVAWFAHVNAANGGSSLMPSWPQVRFQVAFNQGANTSGQPAFVDLSSRIRGPWSAEQSGRQYELDQVQSGQLSMTLWNRDGALDPLNTASPYSPNLLPMRPCRLQAVWPPTRNLLPAPYANGTATAAQWAPFTGTVAPATGLAPAPTGHTTAAAWQFPITASSANGLPLLTGTTASGADATAFPVTGGASYSASAWLSRSAGGDPTITLHLTTLYYDATGAQVGTTASAVTTIPVLGTWVQVTASGTAPATAVSARISFWLNNTATTAANTFYITALQFEQAAAITPWTSGGTLYPLWAGFVERWPQQWDMSGTYGLVDITCIDALAALAQFTLQPSLSAQLLSLKPIRLFPFDEPQGSTTFRNAAGKRSNATIGHSTYGSGTITAGTSITGAGFVGAAGPVVTIANPAPSNTSGPGSFLSLGPGGPSTPNGWSRIICFRTTTVPAVGVSLTLWSWSTGFAGQSQGSIYIDSSQHVNVISQNAAGQSVATFAPGISVCDGNWHMAAIILTPDGKTLNINVDGAGFVVTTANNCNPSGIRDDTIGMAVYSWQKGYYLGYSGDIAYAVDVPTNNIPSFPDLASGFSSGWAGETSAARAQRLLTMAGYLGSLTTLGATSKMGGANVAGVDAMSALQLVGDTEAGQVYIDGTGTITLATRAWRYVQNTPVVSFGESAGEVPYLGDVEVESDNTHIYNDVTVLNQPLPGAAQQPGAHIPDTASQAAYLPRSLQRTINVQDSTVPQSAAQYLVSQYAQPLARVGTLTVDPASNPALWPTVLPIAFGTRAQVSRRPPAGPGAASITVQQFVESITWNGDDKGNLKLSLELSPAAPYLGWWVVSSLHTTVAVASTAGTATVTLSPLTGSASNPAKAVLTPGTQLTLGYGTANAETLTVQSVATTSPGYTSVAVTFTASTAHNHAINEVVCQPLPGGYVLPAAVQAAFPASLDAAATLSATTPRVAY
ncbi:MAG: hypothetical protein HOW97_12205 [Catenulispora sp.]|nr:hypothetical protein [Catenulispora sp.]